MNDNERLPFITLAAAVANVMQYLLPNPSEQIEHGQRDDEAAGAYTRCRRADQDDPGCNRQNVDHDLTEGRKEASR